MNLSNRILVIVNPAAERQLALERAGRLAAATGAELRLEAVVYDPELSDRFFHWDGDDNVVERDARVASALEWLEQRSAALELPRVSCRANWGHPLDEVVVSRVTRYDPDVLILQTRDAARLNLTEWRLLRKCPAPVWLARRARWPEKPKILAAVDPTHTEDEAAALDREIMAAADTLGGAFDTGFEVLHSIDGIPSAIGVAQSPAEYERELRAIRTKRIEALLPDGASDRASITLSNLEPARALRDHCAERKVDLVAMGMLARSRLSELLVGSTARQFVPRSDCDVLLIKSSRD